MSLKDLNKRLESIDGKIAALDRNKTRQFPPVDIIGKHEERCKKIEEQNESIQERFSDMTSQIITNEYGNYEYIGEQMQEKGKL